MPNKTFSISGVRTVHRLGFGAMRLTGWGPPRDPSAAMDVARHAVELGVTLIDTADAYALGANEELLAEALHPYPESLVIATKAGQSRPSQGEWVPLGRPEYLRQQAELSLRRLRLEQIDLFQLHRIDPQIPLADQIGALKDLRDEGKIVHAGLSEVSVDQLDQARAIVDIATVQNRYNLSDRRHEDVLNYCELHGVGFLPWLPIGNATSGSAVARIADELDASATQVALAWLLHRSPVVIPIPGTNSKSHLRENVASVDLALTTEQFARLSERAGGCGSCPDGSIPSTPSLAAGVANEASPS